MIMLYKNWAKSHLQAQLLAVANAVRETAPEDWRFLYSVSVLLSRWLRSLTTVTAKA
jgi:hypothetical protein